MSVFITDYLRCHHVHHGHFRLLIIIPVPSSSSPPHHRRPRLLIVIPAQAGIQERTPGFFYLTQRSRREKEVTEILILLCGFSVRSA